jgi:hypothetical protein
VHVTSYDKDIRDAHLALLYARNRVVEDATRGGEGREEVGGGCAPVVRIEVDGSSQILTL